MSPIIPQLSSANYRGFEYLVSPQCAIAKLEYSVHIILHNPDHTFEYPNPIALGILAALLHLLRFNPFQHNEAPHL
jgi:hypothetical protein